LTRQLGDPLENSLAVALEVLDTGACPVAPSGHAPLSAETQRPTAAAPWMGRSLLDELYAVQ
jgi:hypothetical protein